MGITSLDIINDLSTRRARIINILDFDSKKLSIIRTKKNKIHAYYDHDPFFVAIDNLKGYFEEYNGNKYLTINFTSEYQKLMYTEVLKKINKDINKNYSKIKFESNIILPLNILINIHSLVLVVRYQRVYINTCWLMKSMKKFKYEILELKFYVLKN